MKKIISLFLLSFTLVQGIIVFDPTNHAENLISKIESLKQTAEMLNQTKNQLEQLKNDAINMASLDQALSMGQLNLLQQGFQSIINIQNKSTSAINDYKNLQNQFSNLYTDYKDMKNFTSEDYVKKADSLIKETKSVMLDSTRLLEIGDVSKLSSDSQRVKAIMSAANTAPGQKQVAQAAAQLAAMQIEILAEQRTLMAASLKSQNSYILKKVQEEEIIKSETDMLNEKTVDVSGENANVLRGWKN